MLLLEFLPGCIDQARRSPRTQDGRILDSHCTPNGLRVWHVEFRAKRGAAHMPPPNDPTTLE